MNLNSCRWLALLYWKGSSGSFGGGRDGQAGPSGKAVGTTKALEEVGSGLLGRQGGISAQCGGEWAAVRGGVGSWEGAGSAS